MMQKTVVFDFDGTLTTTDTTKFLFLILLLFKPSAVMSVLTFYRSGKSSIQKQKCRATAALIQGCPVKIIDKRIGLFRSICKAILRKSMVRQLQTYLVSNYTVIIATASPSFALKHLFPDEVIIIGTEYEVINGIYSGRLTGEPCYGNHKAVLVKEHLSKNHDMSVETAYSDDRSDLPVLMLAENSYLVDKNGKLTKVEKV
jgi:phosphoserine phosphatase